MFLGNVFLVMKTWRNLHKTRQLLHFNSLLALVRVAETQRLDAARRRGIDRRRRRAAPRWRRSRSRPLFPLASSLPASPGPVSLRYLHVRSVPEGLRNDQRPR